MDSSQNTQLLPHFSPFEENFHPRHFRASPFKCTSGETKQTAIWQARNTSGTVIGSRKGDEKSGLGREDNEVRIAVPRGMERPEGP